MSTKKLIFLKEFLHLCELAEYCHEGDENAQNVNLYKLMLVCCWWVLLVCELHPRTVTLLALKSFR